jgi:transcriptional regulator with XRE-family HTH domain
MASRLRSGKRMPSAKMLGQICSAFNLDEGEALRAHRGGPDVFSAWLRDKVFSGKTNADDAEEEDAEEDSFPLAS